MRNGAKTQKRQKVEAARDRQADPASSWPAELGEIDRVEPSPAVSHRRGILVARVVGLLVLVAAMAVSLLDDKVTSQDERRLVGVLAVVGAAGAGFLIATYSRRLSVATERAYSSHLEAMGRRLRSLAYRDSLTGLYNHRYFREQLSSELERAQRYGGTVSVLLLDVDHFKEVNDTYGHLMGDTLLSYVAQQIASSVRSSDIAARYGGDEFAIVLPETSRQAALTTTSKLSDLISAAGHWQVALLEGLGVGVSAGVASYPEDGRTADELLFAADADLYRAKAKVPGRQGAKKRRGPMAKSA